METIIRNILKQISGVERRLRSLEARGFSGPMYVGKTREEVISSGSFTAVFDYYVLSAESGSVDNLDSISFQNPNVPQHGKKVLLRVSSGDTVTVKDGTGNIDLTGAGGDITLDDPAKSVVLVYDMDLGAWIVYSKNA